MNTIDLTPTWAALVPTFCAILQNPKADREAKEVVCSELRRMAEFCDQVNKDSKGK